MMRRNNREAVSSVIGVILMVAITIILAAVVFAWVSGYMNVGKRQISAGLSIPSEVSGYEGVNTTTVLSISEPIDETKVKWYLRDNSQITQASGTLDGPYYNLSSAANSTGVAYVDNDKDYVLSTYDVIVVNETKIGVNIVVGWSLRLADADGNTITSVTFQ